MGGKKCFMFKRKTHFLYKFFKNGPVQIVLNLVFAAAQFYSKYEYFIFSFKLINTLLLSNWTTRLSSSQSAHSGWTFNTGCLLLSWILLHSSVRTPSYRQGFQDSRLKNKYFSGYYSSSSYSLDYWIDLSELSGKLT